MDTLSVIRIDTLVVEKGLNLIAANWALVIATVVLAVITFFYMRHTKRLADDTKRMADALVKDYELKVRPILDFDIGGKRTFGEGIEVQFEFLNGGEIPIVLKQLIFTWWFIKLPQMKRSIKNTLNWTIHKQKPVEKWIKFDEYRFREKEPEETKSLEGGNFYSCITGVFRVEYLDAFGKLYSKEIHVENLI